MNSETLRASLIRHEAEKLTPYLDTVGKWTIGVGRNLEDVGLSKAEVIALVRATGIPKALSDQMLTNDLARVWLETAHAWPWVQGLSDVRQRVLCEMVFQMGTAGVGHFVHFLEALEHGDYGRARDEMLDSKWAKTDSPSRAKTLAQMLLSDQDPV